MKNRITTQVLRQRKREQERISMLTAYDYSTARVLDDAGVEVLLVGDSLGMVMLGYDSTIPVTMDEMIHHIKAVARGANRAMVVGDLPFLSYHTGVADAVKNAGRILQEGGAQAVKLEGGREVADTVKHIVAAGIPVMGHLGLTPQQVNQFGGFIIQGKDADSANRIIEDALILQEAGVFAIVLECIPAALAARITEKLTIPTIGIGAGVNCDGQVIVVHDLLGLYGKFVPKFAKQYAQLNGPITEAVKAYIQEVKQGQFPGPEHSFSIAEAELDKLY